MIFCSAGEALALGVLTAAPASAQSWPSRAVSVLVPFPA
jgi:hypothetical protein